MFVVIGDICAIINLKCCRMMLVLLVAVTEMEPVILQRNVLVEVGLVT